MFVAAYGYPAEKRTEQQTRTDHERYGDALVPRAVHHRLHHVVEDNPVGDTAAVAAQRVGRVERGPRPAGVLDRQGLELGPDRLDQK